MIFVKTKLKGAYIIEWETIEDERGFFSRTFCQKEFGAHGLNMVIAQSNISYNKNAGTLRGMHQQLPPYEETKLVRCNRGAIYDVIIDLRENSETYRHWIGVELTAYNKKMLYVPEGFAHGFLTLENETEVFYQISQFYAPGFERGYRWNDPAFNIAWPTQPLILSHKDANFPLLD